jgi:putative oxidoreductase
VLGILFRPATMLLAFTMLVAALSHLNRPPDDPNAGWSGASHALELLSVYLCLMFTGPGKFALILRGK